MRANALILCMSWFPKISVSLRLYSGKKLFTLTNNSIIIKHNTLVSGKVVPKREVVEVIQRFNIQVNNLTQVSMAADLNHDIRLLIEFSILSIVWWFYSSFSFGGDVVSTTRQGLWICQIDSGATSRRDWKGCWWSSTSCPPPCTYWKKQGIEEYRASKFQCLYL